MRFLGMRADSGGLVLTGDKGNRHGQPASSSRMLESFRWLSDRCEPGLLKNLVETAALEAIRIAAFAQNAVRSHGGT
jgi:hypothetical protein